MIHPSKPRQLFPLDPHVEAALTSISFFIKGKNICVESPLQICLYKLVEQMHSIRIRNGLTLL